MRIAGSGSNHMTWRWDRSGVFSFFVGRTVSLQERTHILPMRQTVTYHTYATDIHTYVRHVNTCAVPVHTVNTYVPYLVDADPWRSFFLFLEKKSGIFSITVDKNTRISQNISITYHLRSHPSNISSPLMKMKLAMIHHPLFLTLSLATRAFAFRSSPSFLVRRSVKCFQQTDEEQDTIASISTWTDADDWSKLSSANHLLDGSDIYDQDLVGNAARQLEMTVQGGAVSPDDEWISSMVDQIHDEFVSLDDDTPLYDTSFDEPQMNEQFGDMSNEIAMLIRCNERPQDLLISEGRALPPLSEDEKKNVYQLVSIAGESVQATNFLKESVSIIFRHHAMKDDDDALYLDRNGVAKWMSQALKTEETRVSAHDARVLRTISDFSSYGSGRLVESNFQDLYLTAVVGPNKQNRKTSWKRHLQLRQPHVDAVWRDLRNHGIISPIERERNVLVEKLNVSSSTVMVPTADTIMDECEILDWDYSERKKVGTNPGDRKTASGTMSSHKILEMVPTTNKTPLWMRDGEFSKCSRLP